MLPNATAWPLVLAFAHALPFLTGKGFDAFARSYTFFEPPAPGEGNIQQAGPAFLQMRGQSVFRPGNPGRGKRLVILRAFWKFRSSAIGRKKARQNCADLSQTCRSGKRPQTFPSETGRRYFFIASSTATATATVAPTMGLLPMPIRPIISTCAGTEEEPANWASECMRPMVSVMP